MSGRGHRASKKPFTEAKELAKKAGWDEILEKLDEME